MPEGTQYRERYTSKGPIPVFLRPDEPVGQSVQQFNNTMSDVADGIEKVPIAGSLFGSQRAGMEADTGKGSAANAIGQSGLFLFDLGTTVFSGGTSNVAKTTLTKNSVIEGFNVSNHAWRKSGLGRGASEELVSNVITGARKASTVITEKGTGKFAGNVIKVFNHDGVKVVVDETRKIIMSIRPEKGFKLP